MSSKIIQATNPLLRQISQPILTSEFNTPTLKNIIKKMSKVLDSCPDGVALAGPQIGFSKRLFIVSHKILPPEAGFTSNLVFINPQITKLSKQTNLLDEGCLSVTNVFGQTKRSKIATVKAYTEIGEVFTWTGRGLMAQIFQHEIDHLNGILFIDHALKIYE